jgi:hypothetical protein
MEGTLGPAGSRRYTTELVNGWLLWSPQKTADNQQPATSNAKL